MIIRHIRINEYPAFSQLFCDYYTELDCEEEPLPLFSDCLLPDLKADLFSVGVCEDDGEIVGFVIFQVDDLINDWNFKEGCGDVRELYVVPAYRRRGFGSALLLFAESALLKSGASEVYALPVEESENFFTRCGYADSGEYCAEADNKVFSKKLS